MSSGKVNSLADSVSESEFLAEQAERAKVAAVAALREAKASLQQTIDPRPAMRRHPLVVLASASIAGFVAALMAIPSKDEMELRNLERLRRATHPEPSSEGALSGNGKSDSKTAAPAHSVWTSIIHEVVQLIRPILLTAITTGIKAAASPPPSAPTDPPSPSSL